MLISQAEQDAIIAFKETHSAAARRIFSKHGYLFDQTTIQRAFNVDYNPRESLAIITLLSLPNPSDPNHSATTNKAVANLRKQFTDYFKREGFKCEVKILFNMGDLTILDAESVQQAKQQLMSLMIPQGHAALEGRVTVIHGIERMASNLTAEEILEIGLTLNEIFFYCIAPSLDTITRKLTRPSHALPLMQLIAEAKKTIDISHSDYLRRWKRLREQLMDNKTFLNDRRAADALFELTDEGSIETLRLRPSFQNELLANPHYSPATTKKLHLLLHFLKEIEVGMNELHALALKMQDSTAIYEATLFNCNVIFDQHLAGLWSMILGASYSCDFKLYQTTPPPHLAFTKKDYLRAKASYIVLARDLTKLQEIIKDLIEKEKSTRPTNPDELQAKQDTARHAAIKLPAASATDTPATSASLALARQNEFFGPRNQPDTSQSKKLAEELAKQNARRREAIFFANTENVPQNIPPATASHLQFTLENKQVATLELCSGEDECGKLVVVQIAPTMKQPMYVSLVGLLELSLDEQQNIRSQQGRPLLPKDSLGENGFKLHDDMLILKSIRDSDRVLFASLRLPEEAGPGCCFIPVERVTHAKMESLLANGTVDRPQWEQLRNKVLNRMSLTALIPTSTSKLSP